MMGSLRATVAVAVMGLGLLGTAAFGSATSDPETTPETVAEEPKPSAGGSKRVASTGSVFDRIQLHGYLNLAHRSIKVPVQEVFPGLDAKGPAQEIKSTGMTGSWAFNMAYQDELLGRPLSLVAQVGGELRPGVVEDFQEEIELDLLFAQLDLTETTRLRLGKLPFPRGYHNEVRKVGVIQPFFGLPLSVYGDTGILQTETLLGALISQQLGRMFEVELYGGEWSDFLSVVPGAFTGGRATLQSGPETDGFGGQLWFSPHDAVRLGSGFSISEGKLVDSTSERDEETTTASLILNPGRFLLEAEGLRRETEEDGLAFATFTGWYALVGYRGPKWGVFFRVEELETIIENETLAVQFGLPILGEFKTILHEAKGVSLNYRFSPSAVLKLEHTFDIKASFTFLLEITPDGVVPIPPGDVEEGDETILSFSWSF